MCTWLLLFTSGREKLLVSNCQRRSARRRRLLLRPVPVRARVLATVTDVVMVVVLLQVVVMIQMVLAISARSSSPAKRQTACQRTTHALMSVARSQRTFVSPRTHRHSCVGTSMPSSTDRKKASLCRAHSCSASAEGLVSTRVATVKCSTLATFSSRRSALPKSSPSRRRGKRWRVFGRTAWTAPRLEDSGMSFSYSLVCAPPALACRVAKLAVVESRRVCF
jgi:hypothetical protein